MLINLCYRKLDEAAAKQRQKEAEIEERLARQKAERLGRAPAPSPAAVPAAASEGVPWRSTPVAAGVWRSRQVANTAASGEGHAPPAASPARVSAAAAAGDQVPPAAQNGGRPAGASAPSTGRRPLNLAPRTVPLEEVSPAPSPSATATPSPQPPPPNIAAPTSEQKQVYKPPARRGETSGSQTPPSTAEQEKRPPPKWVPRNQQRGERDRDRENSSPKPRERDTGSSWR